MGLIVFVGFRVAYFEDGEPFSGGEVGDVVGVLTFIGGTNIVGSLRNHSAGDWILHALEAEDSRFAIRSNRIVNSGENKKCCEDDIEGAGELHAEVILFELAVEKLDNLVLIATCDIDFW